MNRSLSLVVVGVVACHATPAPKPAVGNAAAAAGPADLFTGLFAADRTLTYDVTTESEYWDDQDPAADAHGNVRGTATGTVTCTLTVGRVAQLRTATIACANPDGLAPRALEELERTFVTDGQRLWRLEGGATLDDPAAVTARAPDLSLDQHPVDLTEEDPAEGGRFGSAHKVLALDHGWCVEDHSWGGDEGGATWCLTAADGVVGTTWYFAGGSSREERAELRRP